MCNFSWDYSQKFFHKKCDKENFPGPSHPTGLWGGGEIKIKFRQKHLLGVCSQKKIPKGVRRQEKCAVDRPPEYKKLGFVVAWGLLKLVVF